MCSILCSTFLQLEIFRYLKGLNSYAPLKSRKFSLVLIPIIAESTSPSMILCSESIIQMLRWTGVGVANRIFDAVHSTIWRVLIVDRIDIDARLVYAATFRQIIDTSRLALCHELEHGQLSLLGEISPVGLGAELGGGLGGGDVLHDDAQKSLHLVALHIREALLRLLLILMIVSTHEHLARVHNRLALVAVGELEEVVDTFFSHRLAVWVDTSNEANDLAELDIAQLENLLIHTQLVIEECLEEWRHHGHVLLVDPDQMVFDLQKCILARWHQREIVVLHAKVLSFDHVDHQVNSELLQLLANHVILKFQRAEVNMTSARETANELLATDRVGDMGAELEFDLGRPGGRGFEVGGEDLKGVATQLNLPLHALQVHPISDDTVVLIQLHRQRFALCKIIA